VVVLVVLAVLVAEMLLGQQGELTAAAGALAQQAALVRLSLQPPVLAQFVLFTPVLAVHFHQLALVISNQGIT
jgi:hypothetical protein